jgi:hypothetical protein
MKVRQALFYLVFLYNSYVGVFTAQLTPSIVPRARIVMFAGDLLFYALTATVIWRNRRFVGVHLIGLFALGAVFTFVYNTDRVTLTAFLNGIREPLFFLCSLVLVWDFLQGDDGIAFERSFTIFLVIFTFLQMPFALWQFVTYGANDNVGGTYGLGGSGFLTQVLFLITFYFLVRNGTREGGEEFSIPRVFVFSSLLIPAALNETKISFALLPLFFGLIILSPKKVYRVIPLMVLGLLVGLLFDYYYTTSVQDTREVLDFRYVERYLYSGKGEGDMPRLARIPIMFDLMKGDPLQVFLGMGYGLFSGSAMLGMTRLGRSLVFLEGSRVLLFTIWIQGGLLATALVAVAMSWFMRSPLVNTFPLRRFRLFILMTLAMVWLYNDAILHRGFAIIASYLMVWVAMGGGPAGSEQREDEEDVDTDMGEGTPQES